MTKLKISFSILLTTLFVATTACTDRTNEVDPNADASLLAKVGPVKANELIQSGAIDLILDVRTPSEYRTGKLKGATLMPVRQVEKNLEKLLPHKDKSILIYCAVGYRSALTEKFLARKGFTGVIDLQGGIAAWKRAGLPTVR